MPGWVFVSLLLGAMGVVALVVGASTLLTVALLAGAAVSATAGALLRPDRDRPDEIDVP